MSPVLVIPPEVEIPPLLVIPPALVISPTLEMSPPPIIFPPVVSSFSVTISPLTITSPSLVIPPVLANFPPILISYLKITGSSPIISKIDFLTPKTPFSNHANPDPISVIVRSLTLSNFAFVKIAFFKVFPRTSKSDNNLLAFIEGVDSIPFENNKAFESTNIPSVPDITTLPTFFISLACNLPAPNT